MKEDQEYNIRFVKSVERHRCVYDFTLVDYSNRERQENAWKEIADEMRTSVTSKLIRKLRKTHKHNGNFSFIKIEAGIPPYWSSPASFRVTDCKERWRNLRGCLTRHLKRSGKKPYYLTEHMQFVVPFTKTRSRAVLPFIQEGLDDFFSTGDLGPAKDDLDDDMDLLGEPTVESTLSPLTLDQDFSRKRASSPGDSEESNLDFYRSKRIREDLEQGDSDVNFFASVLPDIRSMNAGQKRRMRIGLLKLIDDILS